MPEPLSLAEALEKQKQDKERLLFRGVRAFANRLRLVGFAGIVVGGLLTLAVQAWARAYNLTWLGYVMAILLALTWLYVASLLGVFWWRTRFTAYVLKTHWTWLAVLLGVPIDVFQSLSYRLRVPSWLVLILAGGMFWRWRTIRAEEESRAHASQWRQLFSLSWHELFLLRFPNLPAGSMDDV